MGHECTLWSYALQYPSFLFPGKTQYTDDAPPEGLTIRTRINSINPLNWWRTGNELRKEQPDIVVVRYWLPFMGPALGTILRRVGKNRHTRIICIADNIIPHEKRPGDHSFTKYFAKACHAFVTMSEKVMSDLRLFAPEKPAVQVRHPLYDNFGSGVPVQEAREKLGLPATGQLLLFFGFIRHYKGLDLLLEAFRLVVRDAQARNVPPPSLLIAGEFYEDEKKYTPLLNDPGIRDHIIVRTDFIPDEEVKYYLCAADLLVQPYRNATQSGVTPLAYYFEVPMVVTNVGGLAALVPHLKAGIVTEPDPASIAAGIKKFYELGKEYFIPHLREEKTKYSWSHLAAAILDLAQNRRSDDSQK